MACDAGARNFRLGDLLERSNERVTLDKSTLYREVTVRLHGKGATLRRRVNGAEIGAESRYVARAGQLILSRIDARHGAISLVPAELDGAIITNDFPVFNIDESKLLRQYLELITKSEEFVALCRKASEGSTNRVRIKESSFLKLSLRIPPICLQEQIIEHSNNALDKLARSSRLFEEQVIDFSRLLIAMAHRNDLTDEQKVEAGWKRVRLGEVMQLDLDPVKVDPSDEYPNLGIYSYGKGLFHKPPISGLETSANILYRVKEGQFIYSRLFAFEGSYGHVSKEFDGKFVSGEYPTFTCNPSYCRAEFVYAHFKLKSVWWSLSASSKGLGLRRQRVQAPAILAHEVWLPPIKEQDRIAEVLRAKQQYDALNTFEKDAEALRRSILAKAFRGELV